MPASSDDLVGTQKHFLAAVHKAPEGLTDFDFGCSPAIRRSRASADSNTSRPCGDSASAPSRRSGRTREAARRADAVKTGQTSCKRHPGTPVTVTAVDALMRELRSLRARVQALENRPTQAKGLTDKLLDLRTELRSLTR